MTDRFKELERWSTLQSRAMDRGFVTKVDRHKLTLYPSFIKVIEGPRRAEIHFSSLEEAESWLDGYEWLLEHVQDLGLDLKAAEKMAYERWDQRRIMDSLSRDTA